jgi:predicted metal-dependent HD superfamily phosphohydrolase
MSGSARFTDESGDYLGFQARKVRYSYMEQFFVRVLNQDYNFTNNLTYQTGSEGDIISDFYNKPQVYITEIGLFNDQNEMLAVAKLSAPVLKSFTEEALFDIQLCW